MEGEGYVSIPVDENVVACPMAGGKRRGVTQCALPMNPNNCAHFVDYAEGVPYWASGGTETGILCSFGMPDPAPAARIERLREKVRKALAEIEEIEKELRSDSSQQEKRETCQPSSD